MWYLENNPDGNMDRLTDCFYWAVQTITTVRRILLLLLAYSCCSCRERFVAPVSNKTCAAQVGYGTVPVASKLGMCLSALVSLLGVVFLAVGSGIVGSGFTEILEEDRRARQAEKLRLLSKGEGGGEAEGLEEDEEEGQREQRAQQQAAAGVASGDSMLEASVEVAAQPQPPALGAGGAEPAWAVRLEERQQRTEATLKNVERMLAVLLLQAQKEQGKAGQPTPPPDAGGGGAAAGGRE